MEGIRKSDDYGFEQKPSNDAVENTSQTEKISQEQANYIKSMQNFADYYLSEKGLTGFKAEVLIFDVFNLENDDVLHEPRIVFKKDGRIIDDLIFAPDQYNSLQELIDDLDRSFIEHGSGKNFSTTDIGDEQWGAK